MTSHSNCLCCGAVDVELIDCGRSFWRINSCCTADEEFIGCIATENVIYCGCTAYEEFIVGSATNGMECTFLEWSVHS